MKKILYISNIEVPYRVKFFNELSRKCELTVVYERSKSKNRNSEWTKSEKSNYKVMYLDGINIKQENSFSLKIFKFILEDFDEIIFGCYNSVIQILAIIFMKILRKPYSVNIDGETFIYNRGFKNRVKKMILSGAKKYYIAGDKSSQNLKRIIGNSDIYTYYFSSITENEMITRRKKYNRKDGKVLVIGQYYDYKGLDIAIDVADKLKNINFRFIGSGNRSNLLQEKIKEKNVKNIEIIPFLQTDELEKEYQQCKALLLPSRKECWGLVINEAASYGVPIVATTGSGAAMEFLSEKYDMFLANPDSPDDLCEKMKKLLNYSRINEYQEYLMDKSKEYTIEKSVNIFAKSINS